MKTNKVLYFGGREYEKPCLSIVNIRSLVLCASEQKGTILSPYTEEEFDWD